MQKTSTWVGKCRKCNSPVYYYPAKLLLESINFSQAEDLRPRIVDCACTGEMDGIKHTLSYSFPKEFEKIEK